MEIRPPLCITSRLLPGFRLDGGEVSIEYADRPGDDGRTRYRYWVDLNATVDGKSIGNCCVHVADDLQSGCGGGNLQEGLASLLSFLSACGESVNYGVWDSEARGENTDLFPVAIGEWAAQNSDELSTLSMDLEEGPDLIVE